MVLKGKPRVGIFRYFIKSIALGQKLNFKPLDSKLNQSQIRRPLRNEDRLSRISKTNHLISNEVIQYVQAVEH